MERILNQLYPNDTDEDNFKDFKLRFSLFFLPPVILIIGFCGWFFSIVLNRPKNISVYDYQVIIPLSVLFSLIYYFIYSLIFKKIAQYPINEKNNSGLIKNKIFVGAVILVELLVAFLLIFLLFKIRPSLLG
jgi:hypothetical protein